MNRPETELAGIVDRNIAALVERRRQEERQKSFQERLADRITAFTGSMPFVYLHLVVYGLWIMINLGWIPGIPKFDPTFVILAMEASVEAIFLSTFVLISQNRMAAMADLRADLDLHISLLSEHELTRLITLVKAMAERMGMQDCNTQELQELEKDVEPGKVLDRIEEQEERSREDAIV
jgi:uncharacterized membrane protein